MKHFIHLTSEAGHTVVCPLWKLPQLVADEIEVKRSDIEAAQAQKAEQERIEQEQQAARANAALADAAALSNPIDLTQSPGF